ncbi:MAG TPA: hypothetical protein PKD74_00655 [Candidatus Dependentiae bacterium]|jgi:hypothetical protein|nr:hypothetical protein [Candidatus Dependentiae bacterium]
MFKKTALVIGMLVTSSCAWAQMLIHVDLASAGNSQRQSIVVEDNQVGTCQFDDLLFEITANKQDLDVNMNVKISRIAGNEKIEIANPEFSTKLETPACLALEKDNQPMELTIVAVDIV